jgi:Leucine-rich repeat (LRR) protein
MTKVKIKNYDDLIARMELLPNLKSADFSNSNLSNEQLGHLRELFPEVEIDWIVRLGRWSVKTDATSFSVLIYQYDYQRMTSKDIEVLKYCRKLRALDIGHQAITDISVIGEYLPDLRILILADNKVSDITPLKNLKHLHYLELFINPISDITPLADLKELVDLNFCYDRRIKDYSVLTELPLLERIWLVGTSISKSDLEALQTAHPNAQIVNTGAGSTNSGWRTHERYFEMIKMYRNPYYLSESFTKYDNMK